MGRGGVRFFNSDGNIIDLDCVNCHMKVSGIRSRSRNPNGWRSLKVFIKNLIFVSGDLLNRTFSSSVDALVTRS